MPAPETNGLDGCTIEKRMCWNIYRMPQTIGAAFVGTERRWNVTSGPFMTSSEKQSVGFPVSAGILFGLGLGGFFDGIVLHQVLQWHHMLTSAGYPPDSVSNLELNVLWDGFFHAATYACTAIGLYLLWRSSRKAHVVWSGKLLPGAMLMGWGGFNLVEGIIDHHILGIHHVNETVPREHWIYWDAGFLVWGAVMLIGGWLLLRVGQGETREFPSATRASSPPR